jgi:hypothetical protein
VAGWPRPDQRPDRQHRILAGSLAQISTQQVARLCNHDQAQAAVRKLARPALVLAGQLVTRELALPAVLRLAGRQNNLLCAASGCLAMIDETA